MLAAISGAGIGGLSTAIALKEAGHEVIVFEEHDELRITGAGINLWPNAIKHIYAWGLKEKFDEISEACDRYTCIAADGELIQTINIRHWEKKYGGPTVGMHRRDLADMLAHRVGFENINFGHRLIDFENNETNVVCKLDNGAVFEADFLVGADGFHSLIRTTALGREIGYYSHPVRTYRWRGIVSLDDITFDPKAEVEVIEGNNMFGTMPIGKGKGYWFASGPGLDTIELFKERFGAWTDTHVPNTIAVTPNETIMKSPLNILAEPPKPWSNNRVTIVGDAAHPVFPDLAQGATQAIVDAAILGQWMKKSDEQKAPKYLKFYEDDRRPIAEKVVESSRTFTILNKDDGGWCLEGDPLGVRYEREVESL